MRIPSSKRRNEIFFVNSEAFIVLRKSIFHKNTEKFELFFCTLRIWWVRAINENKQFLVVTLECFVNKENLDVKNLFFAQICKHLRQHKVFDKNVFCAFFGCKFSEVNNISYNHFFSVRFNAFGLNQNKLIKQRY